jgi:hypothetical protein
VILVIRAVEVLAIPAAMDSMLVGSTDVKRHDTYVGKCMLERIPPGQGLTGSDSVSMLTLG